MYNHITARSYYACFIRSISGEIFAFKSRTKSTNRKHSLICGRVLQNTENPLPAFQSAVHKTAAFNVSLFFLPFSDPPQVSIFSFSQWGEISSLNHGCVHSWVLTFSLSNKLEKGFTLKRARDFPKERTLSTRRQNCAINIDPVIKCKLQYFLYLFDGKRKPGK